MKRYLLICAALMTVNTVFAQFTETEMEIIDGITTEMCRCMEAEKMELKTYEAFNAALIHCMKFDRSSFKPLIDSLAVQKEASDFLVKMPDEVAKSIRRDCQLVVEFYANNGIIDIANQINYEVIGMTLAVVNMEEMRDFYNNVFGANFKPIEKYDTTLYQGKFGGRELLLCPADVAKVSADINRHQFDLKVYKLDRAIKVVEENGGEVGEVSINDFGRPTVVVFDPDGNRIVLVEYKY